MTGKNFAEIIRTEIEKHGYIPARSLPGNILLFTLPTENPQDIVLALSPDGSGAVLEKYGKQMDVAEQFRHNLHVPLLAAMNDAERAEIIIRHFQRVINPRFENQFVLCSGYDDYDTFVFDSGSEENLREMTRLIVQSDPEFVKMRQDVIVSYQSNCEATEQEAEVCDTLNFRASARTRALLELALDMNEFTGTALVYNDGPNSRLSGYQIRPMYLRVSVPAVSGIAAMGIMADLKQYLLRHGIDYDALDGI